MKTTAAIFEAHGQPLRVDEIELGDPGPREVVVKLLASGVCGTQIHKMERDTPTPCLLGHEASGHVVAAGRDVTTVSEGDAVLLATLPNLAPGDAPLARHPWTWNGQTYTNMDEVAVFSWATHTIVDERNLSRVADDIPLAEASILGCAGITGSGAVLHNGKVVAGEDVAIWGVGGVGLFGVMAAAAVDARNIIAIDVNNRSLDLAKDMGATACLNPREVDAVAAILDLTGGGVGCAVDTVGSCSVDALRALRHAAPGQRPGGRAVFVQISSQPVTVNLRELFLLGKSAVMSIAGGSRPDVDIPRYLDWYRNGRFPFDKLVTRRYPLAGVNEACDALRRGETTGRSLLEMA